MKLIGKFLTRMTSIVLVVLMLGLTLLSGCAEPPEIRDSAAPEIMDVKENAETGGEVEDSMTEDVPGTVEETVASELPTETATPTPVATTPPEITVTTPAPTPVVTPVPEVKPTEKPAHTHDYKVKETVAATCDRDGYKVLKCSCGATYNETSQGATGHKYTDKVVAPTETAQGYTEHICGVCGYSYKDNYKDPVSSGGSNSSTDEEYPEQEGDYCYKCFKYGHLAENCTATFEPSYICNRCGKDVRNGHYSWLGDHTCEICGALVPSLTCHFH